MDDKRERLEKACGKELADKVYRDIAGMESHLPQPPPAAPPLTYVKGPAQARPPKKGVPTQLDIGEYSKLAMGLGIRKAGSGFKRSMMVKLLILLFVLELIFAVYLVLTRV